MGQSHTSAIFYIANMPELYEMRGHGSVSRLACYVCGAVNCSPEALSGGCSTEGNKSSENGEFGSPCNREILFKLAVQSGPQMQMFVPLIPAGQVAEEGAVRELRAAGVSSREAVLPDLPPASPQCAALAQQVGQWGLPAPSEKESCVSQQRVRTSCRPHCAPLMTSQDTALAKANWNRA